MTYQVLISQSPSAVAARRIADLEAQVATLTAVARSNRAAQVVAYDEVERLLSARGMGVSPDCKVAKHGSCSGDAWDESNDCLAPCLCVCHRGVTSS